MLWDNIPVVQAQWRIVNQKLRGLSAHDVGVLFDRAYDDPALAARMMSEVMEARDASKRTNGQSKASGR